MAIAAFARRRNDSSDTETPAVDRSTR